MGSRVMGEFALGNLSLRCLSDILVVVEAVYVSLEFRQESWALLGEHSPWICSISVFLRQRY